METHPFGSFVPLNCKGLLLGSFICKEANSGDSSYNWFYTNRRNQFWPILEQVYQQKFPDKPAKQKLFKKLKLAVTDVILQCERQQNNNLDTNLVNIVFNFQTIDSILHNSQIKTVYFSSKFVERLFKKHFADTIQKYPGLEYITLPSPSPRYAAMSLSEKISRYKTLLPGLP